MGSGCCSERLLLLLLQGFCRGLRRLYSTRSRHHIPSHTNMCACDDPAALRRARRADVLRDLMAADLIPLRPKRGWRRVLWGCRRVNPQVLPRKRGFFPMLSAQRALLYYYYNHLFKVHPPHQKQSNVSKPWLTNIMGLHYGPRKIKKHDP